MLESCMFYFQGMLSYWPKAKGPAHRNWLQCFFEHSRHNVSSFRFTQLFNFKSFMDGWWFWCLPFFEWRGHLSLIWERLRINLPQPVSRKDVLKYKQNYSKQKKRAHLYLCFLYYIWRRFHMDKINWFYIPLRQIRLLLKLTHNQIQA